MPQKRQPQTASNDTSSGRTTPTPPAASVQSVPPPPPIPQPEPKQEPVEAPEEVRITLTPPRMVQAVQEYVVAQSQGLNRLIYMVYENIVLPNPQSVVDRIAEFIRAETDNWGEAADRVCANLLILQPALSPEVLARKAVTAMAVSALLVLPGHLHVYGDEPPENVDLEPQEPVHFRS